MNWRFNRYLIIGLLVILIISTMANSLIIFYGGLGIAKANQAGSEPRLGPKELIKNNGFGMVSDWEFENASTDMGQHVWAKYDDLVTPSLGKFESAETLDTKVGITLYSYINQTFQKDVETPNYPSAVVCELDWKMNAYHSSVDAGGDFVRGEIFLQIVNTSTPDSVRQWGIAVGTGAKGAFTTQDDTPGYRIGKPQYAKFNVGLNYPVTGEPPYSIMPKGTYKLSLILKLTVGSGTAVDEFICDLIFDNVSLKITDVAKPLVVANKDTFGPYSVQPGNVIDVDFSDGGLENTSLKMGSYRLNNSGTPGAWNTIFTNNKTYIQNWSIDTIFSGASGMAEGENTIDVYCADQLGNFNDSVQITVVKDTVAPVTNASELWDYYRVPEFSINYTASDPSPSGGFNNTVELWFEFNDGGTYQQYKPPEQPNGLFNQSPIMFDITKTGVGGTGQGSYNLYTIGVDNASNHELAPAVNNPDAITIVDYSLPISKVNALASPISTLEFDVAYTATDAGSGIDYVELWYLLNGVWFKFNQSGTTKFTTSPITFKAKSDGMYGLKTVAYDKSGNIELNGTPILKPLTAPDITVKVDTQAPKPEFILPDKDHIRGKQTILVTSDYDTDFIQFYFWLDKSGNGLADKDDLQSTWVFIYNDSEPEANNWSAEWNTADFDRYDYFEFEEHLVILKAVGFDETEPPKRGESLKNFIEVDNVAPDVIILNPKMNTAENGNFMTISYRLDNNDGNFTKFWWSENKQNDWNLINAEDYQHPADAYEGSYQWEIPQNLKDDQETIDIKVEVTDDTGNVGEKTVGPVFINRQGPDFLDGFPTNITLNEDFSKLTRSYTEYETHTNTDYLSNSESLQWYVTGNTKKVFNINGGNNSDDSFTYTSILNKYGTETLTFHLYDPFGLEKTIEQVVTVKSINDPPIVNLPTDDIHVTYGMADTMDFSIYISDVDNPMSELSIIPKDPEFITGSGLNLTFNYPESYKDKTQLVNLEVSDGIDKTSGFIFVRVTGNHRPRFIKDFPKDIILKEGEPQNGVFNLNDHFSDEDPNDVLTFSWTAKNVIVDIINGVVNLRARSNVAGPDKVIFRATDQSGAWIEGVLYLTIVDIPDKPMIKPIPDLNIHWHNPQSDDGYTYDFSYFIFDPDNDDSELIIWVSGIDFTESDWMENDPSNNMAIIFKFPFSAAGKTHRLALYVEDPQGLQDYEVFNVTVIFEEWPVEQIRPISDQSFPEDEQKDNAFDLWDYFQDIDGGTTFEISTASHSNIKAEIDENNYVDLSSRVKDWNTGEGYVELVIIAKDSQPIQEVYAVVKVFVIPVNDRPELGILPQQNITKGEKDTLDLKKYITDVDTELASLKVVTSTTDGVEVEVSGTLLIISSAKTGTYNVQVWVEDIDGTTSDVRILTVKVKPKEDGEAADNTIFLVSIIALIILILIILLVLFVVFTTYKVNEVFLIHKSGILLYHLSSEHKPGRDEEILSGMFTAVQDFIKDSFSSTGQGAEGGEHILREMKIGENNNILIERGKYVYLAVIFSGRGAGKLRTKAREILDSIEAKYEFAFKSWVGDMGKIKGVENLLKPLLPTGATPVITTDKQLGRVPAPPTAGVPAPATAVPAQAQAPASAPAPVQLTTVTPVSSAAAAPVRTQVVAKPAPAQAPAPVAPAPAPVTTTPAPVPVTPVAPAPVTPVAPAPAGAGAGNCPKCGAIPNRFPDGSMLCPKCGYTGK